MKNKIVNLLLLAAILFFCITPAAYPRDNPSYIRVNIIEDAVALRLRIDGVYQIENLLTHKTLYRGRNINTTVTACKTGISLGRLNLSFDKILIKTGDARSVVIDGRRFRGDIQLLKKENGRLAVINHIELEDYIKGILYHEVSHYWPMEALKAQAIVCRTYALYQIAANKSKDYDLRSDVYSQVYGGRTSERYRTNSAVVETKGYALTYRGRVISAYFHATCGGHTEDAEVLWKTDIAPLKGVKCDFCKESPHFNWHTVLPEEELRKKIINSGYQISGIIKDIAIEGKDRSGRVTNLKVSSETKDIVIPAKDFRSIIGSDILRSTNFSVSVIKGDVVFEGLGWGHGVGMCQWGAYFMAKYGYSYREILKYYYPGTGVKLITD